MGAFFNGRCFENQAAALDAYYGDAPVSHAAGTVSHMSYFVKTAGVWEWVSVTRDGAATSTATVVAPAVEFAACDPAQALTDGVAVGWLVGGCLLAVWAVSLLRRVLV